LKKTYGKTFADLDVNAYHHLKQGPDANLILFEAIAEVSGKKFIVDSSKMPRRLRHLMRIPELSVRPVHLIRNPRGQIASVLGTNGLLRSIFQYEVVEAQIRNMLKSIPHTAIHYEELVGNPAATLQRIMAPLGLNFVPQQLQWAEQERHSFAGNHVRMAVKSELVPDERWKRLLSPAQRFLIDVGTTLSRIRAQV
jgi:hypothetical protein